MLSRRLSPSYRRRSDDQGGVVGANLAIVLAFALYAVIQLSRTTLAAQQIDTRVKDINKEVVPINSDLNNVPKLDQTTADAAAILQAAKPLSAQADQIINAAKSIDGHVADILGNASTINGTVHSINATALDIGATVNSIHATASSLAPTVTEIHDGVAAINGRADRALPIVGGIAGDLNAVLKQVGTSVSQNSILGHANAIDCNTVLAALAGPGCNQTFA